MTTKLVLLDDGECQVTEMFDDEGDETSNPEEAHSIVGVYPDGHCISMQVDPENIIAMSVH